MADLPVPSDRSFAGIAINTATVAAMITLLTGAICILLEPAMPWLVKYLRHANADDTRRIAKAVGGVVGDSLEEHQAVAEGTGAVPALPMVAMNTNKT